MPNNFLPFRKGRLTTNPVGWHVKMPYLGQQLLGEIKECHYNEVLGAWFLTVHHFNGQPWPINPSAMAVRVLERTFDTHDSQQRKMTMPFDLTVTCLALLALGVALFVAIYPEQAPIEIDEEED